MTRSLFTVWLFAAWLTAASLFAAQADVAAVAKQFGPPALVVPKPKAAPRIDGKLDDPCWQQARPVALAFTTGCWWEAPTQKTEARVLADDKAIYFAVRCWEAERERIVADGKPRNGMIVGADTVELFLDPGNRRQAGEYFHVMVTPKGSVYPERGQGAEWKASVTAKVGKFDGGWTVEAAVALADLGVKASTIPKIWGLNVCRQRPELGFEMPQAARKAGDKRFNPPMWRLDDAKKYRLPEYTAWSPTMTDFSGWPFYGDSRPFHQAQRFGHASLQVGNAEVAPPAKTFEVIFRSDFDNGKLGSFENAALYEENFRGSGKSLGFAAGQNTIRFTQPLEDLEDVTLVMAYKGPPGTVKARHLSITGLAADGIACGAERYEVFLPPRQAQARKQWLQEYHQKLFAGGLFELYDTHADMVRWKPCGRVRKGPGPWAMVEGYFAEPSWGQVRWPGQEWTIVRLRLGTFRRMPGPKQGQRLVPRTQGYPKGLMLKADAKDNVRIDEMVIFRGRDTEPPERVTGLKVQRQRDQLSLTWNRARDNTLTAFYRIYAGKQLMAESRDLTAQLKAAAVGEAPLTVVAVDLDGNASKPSLAVTAGQEQTKT